MNRKIFRTGNSMVVSLPKGMLDALNLSEGGEVSVELDKDQERIVIARSTVETDGVDTEFARQVAAFIDRYRPALEALAE